MNIFGVFYIILSSIAFSLVGIFVKPLLAENNSLSVILMTRSLLTLIILIPFIHFQQLLKRENLREVFFGGLFYFLTTVFYISAVPYIGVGLSTILAFIFPIYIFIFSIIRKEIQFSYTNLAIIVVSFLGLVLLSSNKLQTLDSFIGFSYALSCGILYAVYIYFNKKSNSSNKLNVLSLQLMGASLYSFILTFFDPPKLNFTTNFIINIILLSFIGTFICLFFLIKSIEKIGPFNTSILSLTEPIFAVIFSYIFIQEKINLAQFIGLSLIILSCFLAIYLPMKKEKLNTFKKSN
ncbi:DMT family transporter [Pigmentibacter sp. JX0631]|uniref:DMT family transporter n=1 Tax=Pigmentibacter sp. JX0631 TaxID=2976982 RepID=UPI002468910D|nr:DMT family transporter [Pigmentibacter sp. JX0631]WGL60467.1 DMT family transporter [Pigmentibacter sp. JX0631]